MGKILLTTLFCVLLGRTQGWSEPEPIGDRSAPVNQTDSSFQVMTFNVLRPEWARPNAPSWEKRLPGVISTIAESGVHLVALQEETQEMRKQILAGLPNWKAVDKVPEKGASIIYDATFLNVRSFGSRDIAGERTVQWAEIHVKNHDRLVWVLNAHFSPFEENLREKSANTVLQLVRTLTGKSDHPVIVCGDLNAQPISPSYMSLVGQEDSSFQSAWFAARKMTVEQAHQSYAAAHEELKERFGKAKEGSEIPRAKPAFLNMRSSTTFHGYHTYGLYTIDHILFGPGLAVDTCEVIRTKKDGIDPSDHFAVRAGFRFP